MRRLAPPEHGELSAAVPGDERSLLALRVALIGRGLVDHVAISADQSRSGEDLESHDRSVDLCVIGAQQTNTAILRDAQWCRRAIRDRGVIVFRDRTRVVAGILSFLRRLQHYRAYPLAHDLFVVEIGVPTLLSDPRVKAHIARPVWLLADRLRLVRRALQLTALIRPIEWALGRTLVALAAPRRVRHHTDRPPPPPRGEVVFEIHTFVNDEGLYSAMRESFIDARFNPNGFVPLTDTADDPYAAITRIGAESTARYPMLCHQDVRADHGAGAEHLLRALEQLDTVDPGWVIAGTAGLTRGGQLVRRVVDPSGGFMGDRLPRSVVTLDENLLVFNGRNPPRCSAEGSGFHHYGTDACLNALASGGSAYVIDFPVTHLSSGDSEGDEYARARRQFAEIWNHRCVFRYVVMPTGTLFLSRSPILRRVFGSPRAVAWVGHALRQPGRPRR